MAVVSVRTDQRARLRVYLNDHLAGAKAGIRLARRCRDSNTGTALGDLLDELTDELRSDYTALHRAITGLGLPVARPKQAMAVAAEWVGRFKLNGQLAGYSSLSRLVELEGLCAGVEAKRSLWISLLEIEDHEPALRALDVQELARRAEAQRHRLEDHRRAAAAEALGPPRRG